MEDKNSNLYKYLLLFSDYNRYLTIYTNTQYSADEINKINPTYIKGIKINTETIYPASGNNYLIYSSFLNTDENIVLYSNINEYYVISSERQFNTYSLIPLLPTISQGEEITFIIQIDSSDENIRTTIENLYNIIDPSKPESNGSSIDIIFYSLPGTADIIPEYRCVYNNTFPINGDIIFDIPIGKELYSFIDYDDNMLNFSSIGLNELFKFILKEK